MEQETVHHHQYEEFLAGFSAPSVEDLDLMEQEADEVPEAVVRDNRRLWTSGIVSVAAGTGIVLASNYGLLSDAKGFFIAAGIVGLGLGLMRLMRRVFRKKTLTLPPLQLRRKAENVTRNAIDTFTTPTQSNRLTRSDTDKVIMGVSGGLAAHSGISSTLIRAAWIIAFAATSGVAAAFYVLLALFMPPAAPRGLPPSRK